MSVNIICDFDGTIAPEDVTDNLLLAGRHTGITGYAAFGPPGSEAFFRRTLPAGIGLIDAWLPNFGDCLLFTIQEILARGHSAAVVLNTVKACTSTREIV